MEHYHKFQKGITYIHTMAGHLIPILTEELKNKIDGNRRLECIDIYGNKCYLEKDNIDVIFSDSGIYHNFHNEEFFNSINNLK